jgi:hypothetical protein
MAADRLYRSQRNDWPRLSDPDRSARPMKPSDQPLPANSHSSRCLLVPHHRWAVPARNPRATRRALPRTLFLGAPPSLISSHQSPPPARCPGLPSGPSYPAVIPLPEGPTKAEAQTNTALPTTEERSPWTPCTSPHQPTSSASSATRPRINWTKHRLSALESPGRA